MLHIADVARHPIELGFDGSRRLLSKEVRLPPWMILPKDQLQVFAFRDYGSVHDHKSPLGSLDAGDTMIDFRLDYGVQLRTLPGVPGHSPFGHVAMTIRY